MDVYIGIAHRFDCIKGMTERSIRENTKADINIIHLYPEQERGVTGFTDVRYKIDKGIYLDVDMIVLDDIVKLWKYREEGKYVCLADGSTEVAVIDRGNAIGELPRSAKIPLRWNVEDYKYIGKPLPADIGIFHFTSLKHQPWFHEHPNKEAIALYERYI